MSGIRLICPDFYTGAGIYAIYYSIIIINYAIYYDGDGEMLGTCWGKFKNVGSGEK